MLFLDCGSFELGSFSCTRVCWRTVPGMGQDHDLEHSPNGEEVCVGVLLAFLLPETPFVFLMATTVVMGVHLWSYPLYKRVSFRQYPTALAQHIAICGHFTKEINFRRKILVKLGP